MDNSASNYEDRQGTTGQREHATDDNPPSDIKEFLHISEDSIEFLRKTVTEDRTELARRLYHIQKESVFLFVSFMRTLTLVLAKRLVSDS